MSTTIVGRRFGRLVVTGLHEIRYTASGKRNYRYQCTCDCGTRFVVSAANLYNGNTRSCGCLRAENSRKSIEQARRHRWE